MIVLLAQQAAPASMPDPAAGWATTAVQTAIVAGGLLAVVLFHRRGGFTARAFDRAPARPGDLTLLDLAAGMGLFVLGPAIVGRVMFPDALPGEVRSPHEAAKLMLANQIGMAAAVAIVLWRAATAMREGLRGFGLGPRRLSDHLAVTLPALGIVLLVTIAASILTAFLGWLIGRPPPAIAHDMLKAMQDADPADRLILVLTAVIGAPIIEEVLFRGLLQTGLFHTRLVASRWGAIVVGSALFILVHAGMPLHAFPVLFVLSLGLGYVYERTGSLYAPMLIHASFNALNVLIVLGGGAAENIR